MRQVDRYSSILWRVCSCFVAVALSLSPTASSLATEAYPSKPITIVVPFGPGATLDSLARVLALGMQESLSTPVIVENKAGAFGNLGTLSVARSKPDGYTLLLGGVWVIMNPLLIKDSGFDPRMDFKPVTYVGAANLVLIASMKSDLKSLTELIDNAKRKPSSISTGTSGNSIELTSAVFGRNAQVRLNSIQYKSVADSVKDVVGGHLDLTWVTAAVAKPLIDAGQVRALGVVAPKRIDVLSNLATFSEQGVDMSEVDEVAWVGILVPASTPDAIVDSLDRAVRSAIRSPKGIEFTRASALNLVLSGPNEFEDFLKRSAASLTPLMQSLDLLK